MLREQELTREDRAQGLLLQKSLAKKTGRVKGKQMLTAVTALPATGSSRKS